MGDFNDTPASRFLENVAEQISYRPLRPAITQELEAHIQDRIEEYTENGLTPEEAEKKAVLVMGDPVSIGVELNQVHHTRTSILLVGMTVLLMLSGLAAAAYMSWSPEQSANGFWYYIPGLILLIFITFKGYPWLARYQKALTLAIFLLYAAEFLWSNFPGLAEHLFSNGHYLPFGMMWYYEVLILAPILVILAYRLRQRPVLAVLLPSLMAFLSICIRYFNNQFMLNSGILIFLCAWIGSLFFMLHRGVFPHSGRRLFLIAAAGCLLPMGAFAALPNQDSLFPAFTRPETVAQNIWDDSYNGLLIQELLSKTPLTEGISLTPAEMMDYCTGDWHFPASGEYPRHKTYLAQSLDESSITLWDILPQHYHNNYLIAVVILLYGWLPCLCFMALLAFFYLWMFSCIRTIRGKLAASAAFSCWAALLIQGILYLLGNLGYQYGTFSNLPLVSEGRISILVNMMLLGFIFSAYRYDHVIDESFPQKDRKIPTP